MRQPVTVYLDTSDYSCLAEVGSTAKGEKYEGPLAALLRLRESGKVVFRYSIVHLSEFLKSERSTIETALRKTEVMTKLCGTKVFRYPRGVWDREFEAFSRTDSTSTDASDIASSDEGEWYPTDIELGDGDDVSYVWSEMEAIAPALMENGRPKREFIRAVREAFDGDFLQQQVPVTNDFNSKEFVLDMLMGNLRPGELTKKAMAGIAEPNLFVSHYFERIPAARDLFRQLGKLESRLYSGMKHAQAIIRGSVPAWDDRGKSGMRDFLKKDLEWPYLGEGAEDPQLTAKMVQGEPHPILKSTSAHIMIFCSYFAQNLTPNRSLREAKRSDLGDLLHATYLPYSDIFRTDSYFGSLIRKHGEKFGGQVVSTFDDLLPAIERALGKQGSESGAPYLRLVR